MLMDRSLRTGERAFELLPWHVHSLDTFLHLLHGKEGSLVVGRESEFVEDQVGCTE